MLLGIWGTLAKFIGKFINTLMPFSCLFSYFKHIFRLICFGNQIQNRLDPRSKVDRVMLPPPVSLGQAIKQLETEEFVQSNATFLWVLIITKNNTLCNHGDIIAVIISLLSNISNIYCSIRKLQLFRYNSKKEWLVRNDQQLD